ncbi:hypothetical protein E4T56_gene8320, partial [Termitomyces sp. T112]
ERGVRGPRPPPHLAPDLGWPVGGARARGGGDRHGADDHGQLLHDHRLYADLRPAAASAHGGQSDHHRAGGCIEFHLVAGDGGLVGSDRAQADSAGLPSFTKLLVVELILSFFYASYNAAMVVYLTEFVPAQVRAAGFSLAYSLATAVGGFTPFIVTWLIGVTGNHAIPGAWLAFNALASLAAALIAVRMPPAYK